MVTWRPSGAHCTTSCCRVNVYSAKQNPQTINMAEYTEAQTNVLKEKDLCSPLDICILTSPPLTSPTSIHLRGKTVMVTGRLSGAHCTTSCCRVNVYSAKQNPSLAGTENVPFSAKPSTSDVAKPTAPKPSTNGVQKNTGVKRPYNRKKPLAEKKTKDSVIEERCPTKMAKKNEPKSVAFIPTSDDDESDANNFEPSRTTIPSRVTQPTTNDKEHAESDDSWTTTNTRETIESTTTFLFETTFLLIVDLHPK
ncbi:hypothetical protein B566_EDAN014532 [Ephemera danica]|nr:hypothetical protein B566_EDAN014532 [Ephemera danica]